MNAQLGGKQFQNATITATKFGQVNSKFSKSSILKMFSVHTGNEKPVFSDSSGLKRFRKASVYGLAWMVGPNVEIKLRF